MGAIGFQKNGGYRFPEKMGAIGFQKKGARVSPYTTFVVLHLNIVSLWERGLFGGLLPQMWTRSAGLLAGLWKLKSEMPRYSAAPRGGGTGIQMTGALVTNIKKRQQYKMFCLAAPANPYSPRMFANTNTA